MSVTFLQHPLCAWLTLLSQAWRKLISRLLIYASPNCTHSWSSCRPNCQNWVSGAFWEAFLTSSSDADHITSMKTEVWPWHLCKHIWLCSFLISAWKQGLPNSGGCLWRGSLIKVSIQSCVLLSTRCCLIPTESLQVCKFSPSTSSWTKSALSGSWGKWKQCEAGKEFLISAILPWKWYLLTRWEPQPFFPGVVSARALLIFQQIKMI